MSGALIPILTGAGARQVATAGALRAAYDAEQGLLKARLAGKAGNFLGKMVYHKAQARRGRKSYRKRTARGNTATPRQESRVDATDLHITETVSNDVLVDKPLLRGIGIGLGDNKRTAKEIFVRGCRINYCFDLSNLAAEPTKRTHSTAGNVFLRMVVAEDLYGMGDNTVYPSTTSFFSGIGTKKPLDFDSTEFAGNLCTKAHHPINTERWKILASRRIVLRQNFESEYVTKAGMLWVPINKRIRFITTDTGTWPKKDLHFLFYYEAGTQEPGDWINQQVRVQTYFADA